MIYMKRAFGYIAPFLLILTVSAFFSRSPYVFYYFILALAANGYMLFQLTFYAEHGNAQKSYQVTHVDQSLMHASISLIAILIMGELFLLSIQQELFTLGYIFMIMFAVRGWNVSILDFYTLLLFNGFEAEVRSSDLVESHRVVILEWKGKATNIRGRVAMREIESDVLRLAKNKETVIAQMGDIPVAAAPPPPPPLSEKFNEGSIS